MAHIRRLFSNCTTTTHQGCDNQQLTKRRTVTLPGIVEMTSESPDPCGLGEAQIAIEGDDGLSRNIRIKNILKGENGREVSLKTGPLRLFASLGSAESP